MSTCKSPTIYCMERMSMMQLTRCFTCTTVVVPPAQLFLLSISPASLKARSVLSMSPWRSPTATSLSTGGRYSGALGPGANGDRAKAEPCAWQVLTNASTNADQTCIPTKVLNVRLLQHDLNVQGIEWNSQSYLQLLASGSVQQLLLVEKIGYDCERKP